MSGVNRYTARYTSESLGSFSVGRISSTLMSGPEEAMTAERVYLKRLEAATSYSISGDQLELNEEGERKSLTFRNS